MTEIDAILERQKAFLPGLLGLSWSRLETGLVEGSLQVRQELMAPNGYLHAASVIGLADSAWYPNLTLTAQGGYQSSSFANWISAPNRLWSIGPSIAQTLFDGGALRAASDQARASYDASVANYRQTVLTGFQEVEDNIAALRILEQEMDKQREAVELSRHSVELTRNQYKAGVVAYLDVITVETTALSNERALVDLLNRRLSASVLLIKALGGGWDVSQLPDNDAVSKR